MSKREFYLEETPMGDLIDLMIINSQPIGDKELYDAIKQELNDRWQSKHSFDFADAEHSHRVY